MLAGTLNIECVDGKDSVSATVVSSNNDVRVRAQRLGGTTQLFVVEVWPASGAISGYAFNQS